MRILHYCSHFSPISETFIYDLINELDEQGVHNFVVTKNVVDSNERPYRNVFLLPSFKRSIINRFFFKLLEKLKIYKYDWNKEFEKFRCETIKNHIYTEEIQIIHAHFGPAGYEMLPVVQLAQIPLFVSFHGFDAFKLPKDPVWMEKLKEVFEAATIITVVSQFMKTHLNTLGCPIEKLHIIHVGKRLKDFQFESKIPDQIRHFLSIGRLTEKKGHIDAITAFQKVLLSYPDITLKIIGGGPLEEDLKSLIERLGLHNNVQLLGVVNHELSMEYLRQADAFILCSKTSADGDQEGIPTVLMEAQAFGKPCVSTFHSGIPEVIPFENHNMLGEEANPESIAIQIEKLILMDEKSLQEVRVLGRKKVESEFNLENEVGKLIKLYESVL